MSQRNPMNERYTTDKHSGTTRRSAASAKPKSKAAASVSYGSKKKSPKDRKAEEKERRKAETAHQRELDRKYYKPDTDRYRKLRRIWYVTLGCAVVFTAGAFLLRGVEPLWISTVSLILAYLSIIAAFYIDFSKIRKERRAYQTRMYALELEQKRKEEQEAKAQARRENSRRGSRKGSSSKGSAQNAAKETVALGDDADSASQQPSEQPAGFLGMVSGVTKRFGFGKAASSQKEDAKAS